MYVCVCVIIIIYIYIIVVYIYIIYILSTLVFLFFVYFASQIPIFLSGRLLPPSPPEPAFGRPTALRPESHTGH